MPKARPTSRAAAAASKIDQTENVVFMGASVMPRIVGGNTSAPAMMIGEKAADLALGRPPLPAEDPAEAAA